MNFDTLQTDTIFSIKTVDLDQEVFISILKKFIYKYSNYKKEEGNSYTEFEFNSNQPYKVRFYYSQNDRYISFECPIELSSALEETFKSVLTSLK